MGVNLQHLLIALPALKGGREENFSWKQENGANDIPKVLGATVLNKVKFIETQMSKLSKKFKYSQSLLGCKLKGNFPVKPRE